MAAAAVRRCFVTVGRRQLHYRAAGTGPAAVLLHGSPGSSLALAALVEALAGRLRVIALDTPGYGASDPLAMPEPEVADYAEAVAQALDALGIERCGLYGLDTGAAIAVELAAARPDRIAAAVLDGLTFPSAAERADLLAHHDPAIEPAIDGSHLLAAWTRTRDQFLFRPWYRRELAARRDVEVPDAQSLHDDVLELLRAGPAYGAALAAAARHDARAPLTALTIPTLLLAREGGAPVAAPDRLGLLPPSASVERVSAAAVPARVAEFLATHLAGGRPPPPPARPAPVAGAITRDYATTAFGQVLVRRAGAGAQPPLLMLHASPGSAQSLVGLIGELATARRVLAFDTLGNGGSDKPPWQAAEIGDYAPVVVAALDDLGVDAVDLYGTHTGAKIALETALLAPARVRRLVLDGLALYDPGQRDELLARYTPALAPSDDGSHLIAAWNFLRDQTLFWPWFNRTRAGIRRVEPVGAAALHEWLLELLASGSTYSIGYRAAFRHPTGERLPLLATPALFAARATDMIHATTIDAAALAPRARAITLPEDDAGSARAIVAFLDTD